MNSTRGTIRRKSYLSYFGEMACPKAKKWDKALLSQIEKTWITRDNGHFTSVTHRPCPCKLVLVDCPVWSLVETEGIKEPCNGSYNCQRICTLDSDEGQQMQQLLHPAEEGRPGLISNMCGYDSSGEKGRSPDSWIKYLSYIKNKNQDLDAYLIWTEELCNLIYCVQALILHDH